MGGLLVCGVRNSMYVAVVAMIVGLSCSGAWFVLGYEEPTLATQFGASYDEYRRHVRRWWPRLRPWGPS